jgi:hypothetical protein
MRIRLQRLSNTMFSVKYQGASLQFRASGASVRTHMLVDIPRDVGIAAEAVPPTRTAAQLVGSENLRADFSEIKLPIRFGGMGAAFAAVPTPGIAIVVRS